MFKNGGCTVEVDVQKGGTLSDLHSVSSYLASAYCLSLSIFLSLFMSMSLPSYPSLISIFRLKKNRDLFENFWKSTFSYINFTRSNSSVVFLVADTQLYKRLRPFVGLSIHLSICLLVRPLVVLLTRGHQVETW